MAEPGDLSPKAFKELKEIAIAEYGDTMTDEEIHTMGKNLLKLYLLLYEKDDSEAALTKRDAIAFAYIKGMLHQYGHSPSVRELAQFMGYQSSRSGQQVLDRLIVRGLIERGKDGRLRFGDRALDILKGLKG